MKPYSREFLANVFAMCDAGEGTKAVALHFKVSESWVRRIKQQRRETGQIAPKIPYSPDLNPIELAFSKLKKLLRDGAKRSVDALWQLCGGILDEFTEVECRNYFRHCGYRYTQN